MRRAALVLLAFAVLAPAAAAGTVVKAAYNANLKKTIIVNARGLTLYYYVADSGGTSTCVNDPTYHCSKVWPPLLTSGDPTAGKGAKQSLLGTITREDGGVQVTYAGHPLYRYARNAGAPPDRKPGDVFGQGFSSSWWVLSPAGKPIKKPRQ
jgi:predicted lipoprotein with Yx(FWY)xxD motif